MRKSRNFLALPVVSLEEGKEIGRIKGLVINPQTTEVAALIVQRSGLFSEQKVIPYPRVVSAGNNALTIQRVSNVEKITSLPQIVDLVKESVQLRGSRVITEGGTALGFVEEFFVDANSGKITAYEISGHFTEGLLKGKAVLPASEVRTIGKDVLVVHNGAEDTLTMSESKLVGGIKGLKVSTSRIIARARQLYKSQPEEENDQEVENPAPQETAEQQAPDTPGEEPPLAGQQPPTANQGGKEDHPPIAAQ